jgi:hypothetical protein
MAYGFWLLLTASLLINSPEIPWIPFGPFQQRVVAVLVGKQARIGVAFGEVEHMLFAGEMPLPTFRALVFAFRAVCFVVPGIGRLGPLPVHVHPPVVNGVNSRLGGFAVWVGGFVTHAA